MKTFRDLVLGDTLYLVRTDPKSHKVTIEVVKVGSKNIANDYSAGSIIFIGLSNGQSIHRLENSRSMDEHFFDLTPEIRYYLDEEEAKKYAEHQYEKYIEAAYIATMSAAAIESEWRGNLLKFRGVI